MEQTLLFNYCNPRPYQNEDGILKFALPKGGDKMIKGNLQHIFQNASTITQKGGKTWCQMFETEYRVVTNLIDWNTWNGVVYIDIDSKHYYDEIRQFNMKELTNRLCGYFEKYCIDNYYCMQVSNSGKGLHIFFYFNVDKNENNYRKCVQISKKYVFDAFVHIGAEEIIKYHNVMDNCTSSPYQGVYISNNEIIWRLERNETDEKLFGKYEGIDEISLDDNSSLTNIHQIPLSIDGKDTFIFNGKHQPNINDITYKSHHQRWAIYESLIVVFKDIETVNKEWEYICQYLVESNGHTIKFYLEEPKKNKWFERFDANIYHSINWLKLFGYEFDIKNEYIYAEEFQKSWKKHCLKEIVKLKMTTKEVTDEINDDVNKLFNEQFPSSVGMKSSALEKELDIIRKEVTTNKINSLMKCNVFDNIFNNLGEEKVGYTSSINLDEKVEKIRNVYNKVCFDLCDFNHIIGDYDKDKDAMTYMMYADLCYRDINNISTLSYDMMADDIMVKEKDWETGDVVNKIFKFADHYTNWCNYNTYSNTMKETLFREALSKYVRKYHGFHPIRNYLKSLENHETNIEKLETYFIRHLGADDTPLVRAMTRNWIVAAVKKMFIPEDEDFFFAHILFLQGATNNGKTLAVTNLFNVNKKQYFKNDIDPLATDKDIGPMIASNWMLQFGESESLKKVSSNARKEFVDRVNFNMQFQKKFENEKTVIKPRCVLFRSSNEDVLFNDVSVDEGDKRNWLIICHNPAFSMNDKKVAELMEEKDLIWATAYKIYRENTDINLELSFDLYKELNDIQSPYKMIKNDDVEDIYNIIFERNWYVNPKDEIIDYEYFKDNASKNEARMDSLGNGYYTHPLPIDEGYTEDMNENDYSYKRHIQRIPSKWVSDYIKFKYGCNMVTLFRKKLKEKGWEEKNARYHNNVSKCWCK